jgi:predicted PurR-regulated permease PerM
MNSRLPFYLRVTIFFIGLIALISILYIARGIIIPIVFAVLVATLLQPVVKFFIRLRMKRLLAIILTLVLAFLLILGFLSILISQAIHFSDSLPVLVDKFTSMINEAITNISDNLNINPQKMHAWISKMQNELLNSSAAAIGQTLVILGNGLVILFLIPVYIFLILFYQPILIGFIFRFFGTENENKVGEIVGKIKAVIQNYLSGLVIEAVIVAILDITALMILGIEYALILGILGAFLNVIPYIGSVVAALLPMLVAFVTKTSPWYTVYVMIAYYFIQLVDNNFIVPYIVASKVKLNALFSIIIVLAGNALWGIPGMFLSIPILAIIKLICDHIESLKPWGYLLGDIMVPGIKRTGILKKVALLKRNKSTGFPKK